MYERRTLSVALDTPQNLIYLTTELEPHAGVRSQTHREDEHLVLARARISQELLDGADVMSPRIAGGGLHLDRDTISVEVTRCTLESFPGVKGIRCWDRVLRSRQDQTLEK